MNANYKVVEVIEAGYYWLQSQAPAGNWVDLIGFPTFEDAVSHGQYEQGLGKVCRIVTKTINVLEAA